MKGQTLITTSRNRDYIKSMIDQLRDGMVINIREQKRTTEQNDKMWAMLSDISRAKPDGRMMPPEMWKAVFMRGLGHEVQFVADLDGNPFPIGLRSSRLTKSQMSDLIEFMFSESAKRGWDIKWGDENE